MFQTCTLIRHMFVVSLHRKFNKKQSLTNYAVAAAPRTAINNNTSSAMVIIASMLPRHPHLRSPWGRGSDIRHIISPMKGVSRTDRKNAHPNPMLRRAPTSPTRAARKVSDKIPNMSNVSAIVVNFFLQRYKKSTIHRCFFVVNDYSLKSND